MPNRSELASVKRPKAAVAALNARPVEYRHGRQSADMDMDGIWLVAGLCVIGALALIDFAAYFQVLGQLPMIITQVP